MSDITVVSGPVKPGQQSPQQEILEGIRELLNRTEDNRTRYERTSTMENLTRQRDEALAKLKNLQAKVLTVQTATSLKRLKVEIEKERGL